MNCSRCNTKVPKARLDLGYTICTECSTEEKVSCHTIYPHKTGGYIQVVSKEDSKNLNRLDRRGTGMTKGATYYKPFVVEEKKQRVFKDKKCKKIYTNYDTALEKVSHYYEEWGYEPTLKYLRIMNSSGEIPLMTRIKIQDIITDRYINPSPRALARKYNKGVM
tara:strand:+ start:405 stop:896 length:492 start_codon:yes stop_codon:yes gene_type:complete